MASADAGEASVRRRKSTTELLGDAIRPMLRRNIVIFILQSCAVSVTSIFVSATSSFLLSTNGGVNADDLQKKLSTVILADEVVQLIGDIMWGSLIDYLGISTAGAMAHALVALGVASLGMLSTSYEAIVLARMLYALGICGGYISFIASLSALSEVVELPVEAPPIHDELQALLPKATPTATKSNAGSLAAYCSVIGSLISVVSAFTLNRLPGKIGMRNAYGIVFCVPASMSLIMLFFFRPPAGEAPTESAGALLLRGLKLLFKDAEVALMCAGSFALRAQVMILITFTPFLVNSYFLKHHLCDFDDATMNAAAAAAQGCRPAYALASYFTGTVQAIDLVIGPIAGLVLQWSPFTAPWLVPSCLLGGVASFLLFTLPGGDPRILSQSMTAIVLGGIGASAGMMTCFVLSADARHRYSRMAESKELGGAIGSMFALISGSGIIFTIQVGGMLTERFGGSAPIGLQSIVMVVMSIVAGIYSLRYARAPPAVHAD